MTKKKLTTVYSEIQEALGFNLTSKGEVYFELAGVVTPYTINKKQLVIPTDEWLKNPDWENTIPFHPLSENTQRKKSEVQESLTLAVSNRVYQVTAHLIHFLFELALNTDAHKTLTPEQRDVLRVIPNVDARTVADVHKLVRGKLSFKGESTLINIFVKRNGLWKGEEYPRVAMVTFPITEQESNSDKKIFDVPFRVRDRAAFFDLLRWIYPGLDNSIDVYSYGSRSSIAPNFHSLMMAFASLAVCTNRVVKIFEENFEEEMKEYLINTKWINNLASLMDYRDDIPPLNGNIGDANEDELNKLTERADRREKAKDRKELRRDISSGRRSILRERDDEDRTESRKVNLLRREEETSRFGRDRGRDSDRRSFFGRDREDDREERGSRFGRSGGLASDRLDLLRRRR